MGWCDTEDGIFTKKIFLQLFYSLPNHYVNLSTYL